MDKVEIKIVGSIPDENTLNEIQSIAKVFVYEQRMKDFKYPIKENRQMRKKQIKHYNKTRNHQKILNNCMSHVMVKGLM